MQPIQDFDFKYFSLLQQGIDLVTDQDWPVDQFILSMDGMSGKKYRQLVNWLVNTIDNPRYLEIGSHAGSTMCAVLANNTVSATAIDNWSELGGPRDAFIKNTKRFLTATSTMSLMENDFRQIDYSNIGKYNIYLYDGPHTLQDQYDGIVNAQEALEDEYILIVDDWDWQDTKTGTWNAIKDCGLALDYVEIAGEFSTGGAGFQNSDWHNGYLFASVRKTITGI